MDNVIRSLMSSYGANPKSIVPGTLGPDMDDPGLALLRRLGLGVRPQYQGHNLHDFPAIPAGMGGGLGMPESRLNMFGD